MKRFALCSVVFAVLASTSLAQEIKAGDRTLTGRDGRVEVQNLESIGCNATILGEFFGQLWYGRLKSGDSCIIAAGAEVTVVGLSPNPDDEQILVRYSINFRPRIYIGEVSISPETLSVKCFCPSGTLFFLHTEVFNDWKLYHKKWVAEKEQKQAPAKDAILTKYLLENEKPSTESPIKQEGN